MGKRSEEAILAMRQRFEEILASSHVVRELHLDGCTAYICDDYCRDKTQEDVDRILRRVDEITYEPLKVAALADLEAGAAGLGVWYDIVDVVE